MLGEGKKRDSVKMLGDLFYIADCTKTDLLYLSGEGEDNEGHHMRTREDLTREAIVKLA